MGKLGILLTTVLLVAVLSFSLISGNATPPTAPLTLPDTVRAGENLSLDENNALNVRLGQLLNLNRAFDDCLTSPVALIDEASVILLEQAETIDGNRVLPMGKVLAFIHDLYGVELDLTDLPAAYTATAAGYFDIIPRGYDAMASELIETQIQPDGSIKATAKLTLTGHDSGVTTVQTETVFVPNSASAFGYNIVRAAITADVGDDTGYNVQNPMDLLDGEYDRIAAE